MHGTFRKPGEVHCDEREDSDYDLSLFRNGDLSVGIDASRMGNEVVSLIERDKSMVLMYGCIG